MNPIWVGSEPKTRTRQSKEPRARSPEPDGHAPAMARLHGPTIKLWASLPDPCRIVPMLRRIPWTPIALTLLVLVSALLAVPPVRDSATLGPVPEVRLLFPASYLAFSPLYDVLDALSLQTVGQHVATAVSVLLLVALWRLLRARARRRGGTRAARTMARAALVEAGWLGGALLALVLLYAFGAVVQRPMAQLAAGPVNVLVVDMHAHTDASHDGRKGWDAEDVRRWHRDGGYDAVYVSDHRSMRGAEDGWANNPLQSGQGVVLLPALEAVWDGAHMNILSAVRSFGGLTDAELRDIDTTAIQMASTVVGKEPVLVQTFPDAWKDVKPARRRGSAGARAIEIVDGAPRGISQVRRDRARILALADSFNLALVAGSNNHGWGRTAPGWTLFRIPSWRGMTPDSLADVIEATIRETGLGATRVVERTAVTPPSGVLLPLSLPMVGWRMFTTLGVEQRVSWIAWTWLVWIACFLWRRGRAGRVVSGTA